MHNPCAWNLSAEDIVLESALSHRRQKHLAAGHNNEHLSSQRLVHDIYVVFKKVHYSKALEGIACSRNIVGHQERVHGFS